MLREEDRQGIILDKKGKTLYIHLCKGCNIEISIRPSREKTSTGYCFKCSSRNKKPRKYDLNENGEFKCKKCNIYKSLDNFEKRSDTGNIRTSCKTCKVDFFREHFKNNKDIHRERSKKWARNNKEKVRGYALKREYNITRDIFLALKSFQDNKCAICKNTLEKEGLFHVDHCHKTKKVRGLLCSNCNRGLGFLKDDINSLKNAIIYLNKNPFDIFKNTTGEDEPNNNKEL